MRRDTEDTMEKTETIRELFARRSVRVYEPRAIDQETKELIIDSAMQAPTAGNMALYTIIDVTDPEKRAALSELCDHQPFVAKAPVLLLFLADFQRWYDGFGMVGQARLPSCGDLLLAYMDALIAAQNAVVAAQSLGIGSCYIGDIIENCEDVSELFALPRYAAPAALLCFGYPTRQQQERPKPERYPRDSIVFENEYAMTDGDGLGAMFGSQQAAEKELSDMLARKWNAPFMAEMGRSAEKWLERWSRPARLEMKLAPEPFEKILRGEKTIELRLDDKKRRLAAPGDTIVFTREGEPERKLSARVAALHRAESFEKLIARLPAEKCGLAPGQTPDPHCMERYYTPEQERRWGVLGIELADVRAL